MTVFLRFADEPGARAALQAADEWPQYIGGAAVDVVGIIYEQAEQVQEPTSPIEPPVALPGFHINLSEHVAALQAFEIDAPEAPARIFAGSDEPTEVRVPESVLRWQAVRALRLHADPHAPERNCLATVHALRDAAPELQRADIDDALQAVLTWRRQSPTLQQIAQAADWSPEFVDQLFVAAEAYDL